MAPNYPSRSINVLIPRMFVPCSVLVPRTVLVPLAVSAAGDAHSPSTAAGFPYSRPFNTQKKIADSDIAVANTPSTRYSKGS